MYKKLLVVLGLMTVLLNSGFGFQGIDGGRGLYRLQDARSEGAGYLTIKGNILYRQFLSKNSPANQYSFNVPFGVSYAFSNWLEVMAMPGFAVWGDTMGSMKVLKNLGYGLLDTKLGVKGTFTSWLPVLKVGGEFFHQFATLATDAGKPVLNYPFLTGNYNEVRGLVTLVPADLVSNIPISLTGNYGFTFGPGGKFNPAVPDSAWTFSGIGAEFSTSTLGIHAEYTSITNKGGTTTDSEAHAAAVVKASPRQYLTFGAAIHPGVLGGLGWSLDIQKGLTPTVPAWAYSLGINIRTQVAQKVTLEGKIAGTVTDDKTGAPLDATVRLPDVKGMKDREFHSDTAGSYELPKVIAGVPVVVEFTKPGYRTFTATVTVEDKKTLIENVQMRSSQPVGTITGTINDAVTTKPLAGRITFPSISVPEATTEPGTGAFTVKDVPAGAVTVTASAAGYQNSTASVTVKDGEITTQNFTLRLVNGVGTLSGTVTDAATKKPVNARISFADPSLSGVTVDGQTGFYKVDKVPAGPIVVKASADGYFAAQATAVIVANGATVQDFALSTSATPAQTGQITGVVTDMTTKAALGATVSFPGTSLPSVTSDPATGLYKATVPIAPLVVACALPGYVTQMSPSPVIIQANVPAVYNFAMLKIGTEITLTNDAIHFAFDKSDILPEGYPALDEWVKLMKNNPLMTAEIQGHTDAVGSQEYNQGLSERRAQSVVSYLTSHGVDGSRLTAIGYGKTRLVVQTQEANAQNRRVIFKVTGEVKK